MADQWQDKPQSEHDGVDRNLAVEFQGCYTTANDKYPGNVDGKNRRIGMLNFYVAAQDRAAVGTATAGQADAYEYGLTAHENRNGGSLHVILHKNRGTDRDRPLWRLTAEAAMGPHHYRIHLGDAGILGSGGAGYGLTAHDQRNGHSIKVIVHKDRKGTDRRDAPVWRLEPDGDAHHYRIYLAAGRVGSKGDGVGYGLTCHDRRNGESMHVILHKQRPEHGPSGSGRDCPVWRVLPAPEHGEGLYCIEMRATP